VRLQIFSHGDQFVDTVVTLHQASGETVGSSPARPATFEINNLRDAFPELAKVLVADIVITPETRDAHIWAFVTSTNNDTQQFNHFVSR
jgi:hypothetical protein